MQSTQNVEIEEYIFTGYCKVKNQSEMFTCEYSIQPYGPCLETIMGCNYLNCQYNKECTIVKQALAKEDE